MTQRKPTKSAAKSSVSASGTPVVAGRNRPESKRKHLKERRLELRDRLWPDAPQAIWDRTAVKGFSTIPRVLPHVCALIRQLTKPGDPTAVYIDLWARQMDDMLVDVESEAACAFSSGFCGNRAVRTWRERVDLLEDAKFIRVKPKGVVKHGYVLILNPLDVVLEMHSRSPRRVPEEWWNSFLSRADEVGTELAI